MTDQTVEQLKAQNDHLIAENQALGATVNEITQSKISIRTEAIKLLNRMQQLMSELELKTAEVLHLKSQIPAPNPDGTTPPADPNEKKTNPDGTTVPANPANTPENPANPSAPPVNPELPVAPTNDPNEKKTPVDPQTTPKDPAVNPVPGQPASNPTTPPSKTVNADSKLQKTG